MTSADARATPRARNRRGQGAQLRGDILRAAQQLLDEGGGQAVTLRAVARRAGIAAPSIYPHFSDRDAILLALAQDAFAALEQELRRAQETAAGATGRLIATCTAYLDFARAWPNRYRIMFGAVWNAQDALQRFPERSEDLTQLGTSTFTVLVDALVACVQAEESVSVDPFADATALWVGLHGLAQLRAATPLFPWPPHLEDQMITRLAWLEEPSHSAGGRSGRR